MRLDFHLIVGLFLGAVLYYFTGNFNFVFLMVFASLIPDLDVIPFAFKKHVHRMLFHNIWFVIIVSAIFYLAFNSILITFSVALAILIHMAFDSFTALGTHLLYPYRKKTSLADLYLLDRKAIIIERTVEIICIASAFLIFTVKKIPLDSYTIVLFVFIAAVFFIGEINRTGLWVPKRAPRRPE